MIDTSDLEAVNRALDEYPDKLRAHANYVTARTVDAIAEDATNMALEKWSKYGRGLQGSAGQFEPRMGRERNAIVGYVFLGGGPGGGDDAVGGIMQERGTSTHPPNSVMEPASARHEEQWRSRMADVPDL